MNPHKPTRDALCMWAYDGLESCDRKFSVGKGGNEAKAVLWQGHWYTAAKLNCLGGSDVKIWIHLSTALP